MSQGKEVSEREERERREKKLKAPAWILFTKNHHPGLCHTVIFEALKIDFDNPPNQKSDYVVRVQGW